MTYTYWPHPHGWNTWHHRLLSLANHVASWSKDPSTQTGCVIADGKRVVSLGYNGLPSGVRDSYARLNDRPTKYAMTIHAEVNALLEARNANLVGCTAYVWPWPPCSQCAAALIQAGIKSVWTITPTEEQIERWGDSFKHTQVMFNEAQVSLKVVPPAWLED